MSIFSSIWGLFSKKRRLQNDLQHLDLRIARLTRQINSEKLAKDKAPLRAQRELLAAERSKIAAQLDALG